MPGLNQTGPMGQGPRTGRGMGRCNPDNKGKTDNEILQNKDSALEKDLSTGCRFGFARGQGRLGRGLGRQNRYRGGN